MRIRVEASGHTAVFIVFLVTRRQKEENLGGRLRKEMG